MVITCVRRGPCIGGAVHFSCVAALLWVAWGLSPSMVPAPILLKNSCRSLIEWSPRVWALSVEDGPSEAAGGPQGPLLVSFVKLVI